MSATLFYINLIDTASLLILPETASCTEPASPLSRFTQENTLFSLLSNSNRFALERFSDG